MNTAEAKEHNKRTLHLLRDSKSADDIFDADLSKNNGIYRYLKHAMLDLRLA